MAIKRKNKLFPESFSIQVTAKVNENIYLIGELEKAESKSDMVRKMIDFYIEKNYPNLV